jgi:oligopeptidase B
MLYKKGTDLTSENLVLQYAYGAYGYSEDDNFFQSIFSLVDRGFVFVIAHVRGGSEMGYSWYEDGKLLKKKNTFNDFIDVSKYLINEGYTSPDKLFAMGGSAGGLLMGAIVNMNPELYKAVIAEVPFVDVVTTMLDPTIPLTTGEYEEWGNPNEEEYYNYILSYSPYDNVKEQDYPAMLVTTGLHDSQVQYWEPAKWVAKLRDYKTDNNPLYLYTTMKAGHSGNTGRYGNLKETAKVYTFILDIAGIKE